MSEAKAQLSIILPDLTIGGLLQHACTLAKQAKCDGISTRIISSGGNALASDWLRGLDVCLLETWEGLRASAISEQVTGADVLLLSSPQTAMVAPLLSQARSAAVGVHGSPGTNCGWLGDERFGVLAAAVACDGGPQILVPARAYVDGVAKEFGVQKARVSVIHNAIFPPSHHHDTEPGMAFVLAPMRLSPDKHWVLRAAANLAAVGNVPLKVIGEGPAAEDFRSWLSQISSLEFDVVETSNFDPYLSVADVVVAVGIVALEAAARGRRVAVAAKPGGGLAGVLTPSSFGRLQDTNFSGLGLKSEAPESIWNDLGQMTQADCKLVAQLVGSEASPKKLLENLRCNLRPTQAPSVGRLSMAMIDMYASLEKRFASPVRNARKVDEGRAWWQSQAEGAISQLQEAVAYNRKVDEGRTWWQSQAEGAISQLQEAVAYNRKVDEGRAWWQSQAEGAISQLREADAYVRSLEQKVRMQTSAFKTGGNGVGEDGLITSIVFFDVCSSLRSRWLMVQCLQDQGISHRLEAGFSLLDLLQDDVGWVIGPDCLAFATAICCSMSGSVMGPLRLEAWRVGSQHQHATVRQSDGVPLIGEGDCALEPEHDRRDSARDDIA